MQKFSDFVAGLKVWKGKIKEKKRSERMGWEKGKAEKKEWVCSQSDWKSRRLSMYWTEPGASAESRLLGADKRQSRVHIFSACPSHADSSWDSNVPPTDEDLSLFSFCAIMQLNRSRLSAILSNILLVAGS